jgi:hypothetical protein
MNRLQLFTRYYITKVERGMDQRRSRGTELPCKLREGLNWLMRRLSRNEEFVWRRATTNKLKIIKRGGVTSAIKMGKDTIDMVGLLLLLPVRGKTPKCSIRYSCVQVTDRLAQIRYGTATTHEGIHNTRS